MAGQSQRKTCHAFGCPRDIHSFSLPISEATNKNAPTEGGAALLYNICAHCRPAMSTAHPNILQPRIKTHQENTPETEWKLGYFPMLHHLKAKWFSFPITDGNNSYGFHLLVSDTALIMHKTSPRQRHQLHGEALLRK